MGEDQHRADSRSAALDRHLTSITKPEIPGYLG